MNSPLSSSTIKQVVPVIPADPCSSVEFAEALPEDADEMEITTGNDRRTTSADTLEAVSTPRSGTVPIVVPQNPPEWFQKKKAAQKPETDQSQSLPLNAETANPQPMRAIPSPVPASRKAKNAEPPLVQVQPDQPEELTWRKRLKRWFLGVAGTSYGLSLLLHLLVLSLLGIVVVAQISPNVSVSTTISQEEALPFQVTDSPAIEIEPLVEAQVESQFQKVPLDAASTMLAGDAAFNMAESKEEDGGAIGDEGFGFHFKMPEGGRVINRGSFTAWTVPNDPKPGEDYMIVIRIRLPDSVRRYKVTDLTGTITGTDGYKCLIPYDRDHKDANVTERGNELVPVKPSDSLKISANHAQLMVKVPGAASLVRDTIEVRSKLLKEEQKLEIEF